MLWNTEVDLATTSDGQRVREGSWHKVTLELGQGRAGL